MAAKSHLASYFSSVPGGSFLAVLGQLVPPDARSVLPLIALSLGACGGETDASDGSSGGSANTATGGGSPAGGQNTAGGTGGLSSAGGGSSGGSIDVGSGATGGGGKPGGGSGGGSGEQGGAGGMGGGSAHGWGTPVLERPIEASGNPTELLACLQNGGGFSGRTFMSTNLPELAVYADGTMYFGAINGYSYELMTMKVTAAALVRVLRELDDWGLYSSDIHIVDPLLADANTWSLRLLAQNADVAHVVYPSGAYGDSPEGTALSQAAALLSRNAFSDDEILVGLTQPEFERVAIKVRASGDSCPDADPWPLEDLPEVQVGAAAVCLDVSMEDALAFAPIEPEADSGLTFRAGDLCLSYSYRPVLPHEKACADGEPSGCAFE